MKKILILISLIWTTTLAFSNDSIPRIIRHMQDNVTIVQDSAITQLMVDKQNGVERKEVEIQGYRVQVFSSNNQRTAKSEAFRIQKMVEDSHLEAEIYVQYNPPFWKVRLGNFRTQEEAQLFKEEVVRTLPELQGDTYPVRDKITVIE